MTTANEGALCNECLVEVCDLFYVLAVIIDAVRLQVLTGPIAVRRYVYLTRAWTEQEQKILILVDVLEHCHSPFETSVPAKIYSGARWGHGVG